ncbi:MAG: type II toxin-antitoxin system VapC family toxin [Spirochaetota bacterium]|nr:type II toxin-antitoxin system VapC family toxin [Spirochaetota bacterium]
MNYFLDTSALIKNYIEESGSDYITQLLDQASNIYVSELTIIECYSTLRRILLEKLISKNEYIYLKQEIYYDFEYFHKVEYSAGLPYCEIIIDTYQLKTLDSIQLAASLCVKDEINAFVCSDNKLLKAAKEENLEIINPVSI